MDKEIKVNIGKVIFSRSNCVIRTVYTHEQSSTSLLFHMQQPGQKKVNETNLTLHGARNSTKINIYAGVDNVASPRAYYNSPEQGLPCYMQKVSFVTFVQIAKLRERGTP